VTVSVSVCVPVYNRVADLPVAVASALRQPIDGLEVVVVDNASTDGTWEAVAELAADDRRVRAFRNETNVGPAANWERAVALARGTYVKYLGSDERLLDGALPRLLDPLEHDREIGFAYGAMRWTVAGVRSPVYYEDAPAGRFDSEWFLRRAATMLDDVPATPAAALLRRRDAAAFISRRVPSSLGLDFDPWMITTGPLVLWRCCARYPRLAHVAEPCVQVVDPIGEPAGRTRLLEEVDKLWWSYRDVFAHFLATADLPPRTRRTLTAILFLATVPLRPRGFRRQWARFGSLFPERYRWQRLPPPERELARLAIRRLLTVPRVDEVEW
jgi:Glycosyl transferase family 2